MGINLKMYQFNINIKYSEETNLEEASLRIAKSAAQVLLEVLPIEKVDELTESYYKARYKEKKKNI